MNYVDATCPLVSKVHREAEHLYKKNIQVLLIGHKNHPEVVGTMGQLPNGSIDLIESLEDAKNPLHKFNYTEEQLKVASILVENFKKMYKQVGYPKALSYSLDRALKRKKV